MQDGRSPTRASGHSSRECGRLGRTVQRHEPVGNDGPHAAGQRISPAHASFLPLGADGLAQGLDGDIIEQFMAGKQPRRLTLMWFQRNRLMVDWHAQRQLMASFEEDV